MAKMPSVRMIEKFEALVFGFTWLHPSTFMLGPDEYAWRNINVESATPQMSGKMSPWMKQVLQIASDFLQNANRLGAQGSDSSRRGILKLSYR